ncbi:hypothetical protein FT663_04740 [Candidozyma haemuli var. vulneris]|nr:hypothetical protein FT662_05369 [[Candida] haemuloni var. vulneris]KAF3986746.1 hypothetical protein FT663_04740 [[Candida] haemuloni var. vulneris]
MKTDWHRYNLKRRVTQLPPVDEETFQSKSKTIESGSSSSSPAHDTEKSEQRKLKQDRKVKRERLRQQRESLLKGVDDVPNKPEPNQSAGEDDANKIIEEKIKQRVDIKPTTCLFCQNKKHSTFNTVEENVSHMTKVHGLFIPEKKYLVDVEGLISYLGEKLGLGNVCLSCSYQGKNLEAVREHMHSKRHIRIPYETEEEKLEISDFYDFSSTYFDNVNKVTSDIEDDAWEDVSGDEEDLADVYEESGIEDFIINLGDELVLPSGVSIGHRASGKPRRPKAELVLSEGQGTVVAAESRQIFTNTATPITKAQQAAWKSEKKMHDLKDKRSAKYANNQPHFRDQLLQ